MEKKINHLTINISWWSQAADADINKVFFFLKKAAQVLVHFTNVPHSPDLRRPIIINSTNYRE